jgi:hypothetical protein
MDNLNEGGLSNEGLFWLDNMANFLEVPPTMSHEEYAQDVLHSDLEVLFRRGWVRIQSIPQYLLVDLRKKATVKQSDAMIGKFKDKQYQQIIVSRNPSDYQNFTNVISAIDYAETGRLREATEGSFTEWLDRHGK